MSTDPHRTYVDSPEKNARFSKKDVCFFVNQVVLLNYYTSEKKKSQTAKEKQQRRG